MGSSVALPTTARWPESTAPFFYWVRYFSSTLLWRRLATKLGFLEKIYYQENRYLYANGNYVVAYTDG